ncbi:MAG: phosphoglucosamine mutase [Candidatus Eisenbacteria bacterium]|uniref:Phosphoglucosamine mutase n=1 Tax=Eiseniibacteriota bacterium TaxID=2212470 RepID=A0A538SZM2_UNCEI|nr:MAG: phosphoglucosamine mutase [Candidatus Eisenbacteria bacterium]
MVSASGVRGIVGQTLTPDVVLRVAGAHASFLDPGPVVVGRDTRPSGEWVLRLTEAALLASGQDVIDVGIAPTPTILYAIRHHRASGGIAITASHNPAPWNALKLFGPGGTFLAPAQSEEVARRASQGRASWVPNAQVGALRSDADAILRHREAILSVAGLDRERIRKRRFRVVVDATNGAGSEATPALLEALGCEVDRIFCVPDGRFPRVPEPLPENLGALRERVRATGAAVGFANDPDADRLAMVDERGEPIGEERTLQIAIDWALALAPGPVVVNSSTSMAVDLIARRYGVPVHRTKVGEAHVAQKLIEIQGRIGGEGNGGVIYPALHATRDGLLAAAIALDWLSRDARPLSARVAELPQFAVVKRKLDLRLTDPDSLQEALGRAFPDAERNVLDGEKYLWEDSWVQVRASGTEPIVRILAEAKNETAAAKLAHLASEAVERSQAHAQPR